MSKFHSMLIAIQTGRATKLANKEIKSTLARDVAPALAVSIIAQPEIILHTEKAASAWGQLPAERSSSIVADILSNWINRLGGAIRIVELYSEDGRQPTVFSTNPKADYLAAVATAMGAAIPDTTTSKITIGLSSLVSTIGQQDLKQLLRLVKTGLKERGIAAGVVLPRQGIALNAAAIKHYQLTTKGYEFVLWPGGRLGLTLASYDPDRDALLDRGIPASNPEAGMLPPKLARMMVNLAVGADRGGDRRPPTTDSRLPITDRRLPTADRRLPTADRYLVVDPFCGNGRVLLEALLLGYAVLGNDLERAQTAATAKNISWLLKDYGFVSGNYPHYELSTGDARDFRGTKRPHVVVTESWLGPALRAKPTDKLARRYADQVINLLRAGLKSWLKNQPAAVVMALPHWRCASGKEVEIIDNIRAEFRDHGYDCRLIETVAREDSLVARDIVLAKPALQNS